MLKLIIAAAPYFLKASGQTSEKQMARSFTAIGLFVLSVISFIAAIFVFITLRYGLAEGFLSVGAIFFLLSCVTFLRVKKPKRDVAPNTPPIGSQDPIAALLPASIMKDPATSRIMNQVSANPIATTLAAVAIGTFITHEIMKD